MENPDNDPEIAQGLNRIAASIIERAGGIIYGMDLKAIGEDAPAVANLLFKISSFLERRADGEQ